MKLNSGLIRFLDKHKFNKYELMDSVFISNSISNYGDYGGEYYSDEESIILANLYIKLKQKNYEIF